MLIVYINSMKIQAISNEKKLTDELQKFQNNSQQYVECYSGDKNSLDILSFVASGNASLVIMDDDFTSPHSVHLLESIRKVNKEQKIIFLTSDDSLELGKKISSLGVQFYAIKPISENEMIDSVRSILKIK
jgi:DNA-binding NarL/FixJ family response regulator